MNPLIVNYISGDKKSFVRLFGRMFVAVFFSLIAGFVKAEVDMCQFNDSCDTLSKREFFHTAKSICLSLHLLADFSDDDLRRAIEIYNAIFVVGYSGIQSKKSIKNLQVKMDKYCKYAFPDKDENITERPKCSIIFKKLGVKLYGGFQVFHYGITCADVYALK